MKAGFLIESDFILKSYYRELSKYADCFWALTDKDMLGNISEGKEKVVYRNCRSLAKDLKLVLFPKLDRLFKSRKNNELMRGIDTASRSELLKRLFLAGYVKKVEKLKKKITPDIWLSDCYGLLDYTKKDKYWVQTLHALTIRKYVLNPLISYPSTILSTRL